MKLIDVTNSHADLVREQLANTDAQFVKVYSLGQTTVIFTGAATHEDVIILNKNRRVKQSEIDFVLTKLLHLPLMTWKLCLVITSWSYLISND